jgi:hypothetical protein
MVFLCACGKKNNNESSEQTKEESTQETVNWIEPEYIDFNELLISASEEHKIQQSTNDSLDENSKNVDAHLEDENAISVDELNTLKTYHAPASSVSVDEAISDVELLFRLLKYGYGGYYYFGGDSSFFEVRDNIINSIKSSYSDVIAKDELSWLISENLLSIIYDLHFVIDDLYTIQFHPEKYSLYYYDNSHLFSRDENGFYKTSDQNEKYYFTGFEKSNSTIEPTLLNDGNISYSPVQFVKADNCVEKEQIFLKSEDGKEIKEEISWKLSHPLVEGSSIMEPRAMYYSNGDLAYYSIKSFPFNSEEIQKKYIDKASSGNESKAVVMDIRSNSGGDTDEPIKKWIENYSGTLPSLNSLSIGRVSLIDNPVYSGFIPDRNYGKIIENDRPLIVLVDNMCGSNGETALSCMKSLDNSLVIGSNSAGAQVCGNQRRFFLPNSGIFVRFGYALFFKYDYKNIDYEGYRPDVWWDPSMDINCIFKMLRKNGYLEQEISTDFMKEYINSKTKQVGDNLGELKLVNQEGIIKEGESLTDFIDAHYDIMRNGSTLGTSDYEIGCVSEGIVVEKESGKLHLLCDQKGQYMFELDYKDEQHIFILNVE